MSGFRPNLSSIGQAQEGPLALSASVGDNQDSIDLDRASVEFRLVGSIAIAPNPIREGRAMKKLHDDEIQVRLATIPGWEHVGDMLVRTWQFASGRRGLEFINQAWAVADRLKHYPEIVLSYRTVRIEVNSRDEGGLTDRDFQLAAELNALPDDR